jgi:hypothetical protein
LGWFLLEKGLPPRSRWLSDRITREHRARPGLRCRYFVHKQRRSFPHRHTQGVLLRGWHEPMPLTHGSGSSKGQWCQPHLIPRKIKGKQLAG